MGRGLCDLHMHSTLSDGTVAPEELARRVAEAGVELCALTDHDTLAGVGAFVGEARRQGVEVIGGVELSTVLDDGHGGGPAMHLLGYFAGEPGAPRPIDLSLAAVRRARDLRNQAMIEKLVGLGYEITLAEVEALAAQQAGEGTFRDERSVGRPHIAQVLVDKGAVGSVREAFDTLLGRGQPAYVPRQRVTAAEGLAMIAASGGVGVVAHPVHLGYDDVKLERALGELCDMGLAGVEAFHSDHDPALAERYARIAARLGLLTTGGSDFHGAVKPGVTLGVAGGNRALTRELGDRLLERLAQLTPIPATVT